MVYKTLLIIVLYPIWILLVLKLFATPYSPDYPMLKERFGTILWHSSDKDGVYLGSYNDSLAVDHNYCYYPKPAANTTLILKRIDNGDCSNWYGQVTFREAAWASEYHKYNWN